MTKDEIRAEHKRTLEQLPIEFRSSFSYHAYEKGHSGGEKEELIYLIELVNDIKPSIDDFEKRIRAEYVDNTRWKVTKGMGIDNNK